MFHPKEYHAQYINWGEVTGNGLIWVGKGGIWHQSAGGKWDLDGLENWAERIPRRLNKGKWRVLYLGRISPKYQHRLRVTWEKDLGVNKLSLSQQCVLGATKSTGGRGDQARQLIIDLETRGKQAFPVFLSILRDTGQGDLADMLGQECESPLAPLQLLDLRPVELELRGEKQHKSSAVDKKSRDLEMVLELQKLARRDHSALDCCIVVILSHGCQTSHIQFPGGVYGTDGKPIPIEKIVNYFNGSNCPSLRGKPKLFFIQACGGEQKDRGFIVDCDSPKDEAPGASLESDATPFRAPSGNVDEPDAIACLPTPSDILVSYSTFPGFVSWREATGSWYVETLDSVLERYARSEDLLNMLLRCRMSPRRAQDVD
ncbi:caspase 9 [Pitangus sulphuratus]|nr:caspase 9 [Pitangus sulphuratus]